MQEAEPGRGPGDPEPCEEPAELDAGPRLLAGESTRLRGAVRRRAAQDSMVTLRVSGVVAFDAAGIGLLLGLHRLARAGGSGLVVVGPPPRLMAALRRRGLHRVLVIEQQEAPSRAQARRGRRD